MNKKQTNVLQGFKYTGGVGVAPTRLQTWWAEKHRALMTTPLSSFTRGNYEYIYNGQFRILLLLAEVHLKTYKVKSQCYTIIKKGVKLNSSSIGNIFNLSQNKDL